MSAESVGRYDRSVSVQRFEAVVQAEGPGVFIEVPLDVPTVFGRARPAIRGTIAGHPFRSTIAVYGGRYYLPLKRALREAAGVAAGDTVPVELELDETPRTVEPPSDLRAALGADPDAAAAFERLSYTHRREYAEWVAGARRAETRRRRVERALAMLREGRRSP
jgi:Bacteriocin-protection, YdeI or OmpD-Associated/Domain of unknown function (DUF1905)